MKSGFYLLIALLMALLPFQTSLAECSQRGGDCGGSPFKDCCNRSEDECRSIYDDKALTPESNEIGECKEKQQPPPSE